MAVFLYFLAFTVGADYFLYMFRTKLVLGLGLLELFAGIDEENVFILFTAFFHHEDTCRDARAIENVGGETDDGIDIILFLDKVLANFPLGRPAEKDTMRSDASHCSAIVEVVNHVQDKGVVSLRLWGKNASLAEPVIVIELDIC